MAENEPIIVQSISDVHLAIYQKMVSGMAGVVDAANCIGYDSGHKTPALPQKGIKVAVTDLEIDRLRPTPLEGNRVEENLGDEITHSYGGEVFTGHEARRFRYPLPVFVVYSFYTWSHRALDQFEIDHAFLRTFPERGVLTLTISGKVCEFFVQITGTQTLDDLSQNIRERVYQMRLEAWIAGHLPDRDAKIITSVETGVFTGDPEDRNLPGGTIPELVVVEFPD